MENIDIIENPEMGTAGISSAFQLVESTASSSIEFGTAPTCIVVMPQKEEKKAEIRQEETFRETLHRVMRSHKEVLDRLDEL
jgi:hypothetical protein